MQRPKPGGPFRCWFRRSASPSGFSQNLIPVLCSPIKRIKDRVTQLTDRRRTPVPLEWMTDELNRTLRGWSNYFHYRNSSGTFKSVKMHIEERMRTQLRRRYQLRSRAQAYQAFPGRFLYDRLGLFKLPTTANWRSAHASV